MPHLHADYHEQGVDAPYYFAPAAEPFHAAITPWQREAQTRIGQANAATFDQNGRLYFTRRVFDLLYPSYGDTWPLFNGAIGMTYEQGGGPRAGLAIETGIGDTLTLGYRIQNHVATSLNNVAVAARDRTALVDNFRRYFATPAEGAPFAAYVVRQTNGPARLAALRRVLDHNGLAYATASARTAGDGFDYRTGRTARTAAEPGDLVVPADQPNGRLVRVLFEPEAALADSLTYDVTAWALPYALDLDAVALRMAVPTRPFAAPTRVQTPDARAYAYAFPWGSTDDARMLAGMLRAGLRVRSVQEAGRFGDADLRAGSLIVARADNARLGRPLRRPRAPPLRQPRRGGHAPGHRLRHAGHRPRHRGRPPERPAHRRARRAGNVQPRPRRGLAPPRRDARLPRHARHARRLRRRPRPRRCGRAPRRPLPQLPHRYPPCRPAHVGARRRRARGHRGRGHVACGSSGFGAKTREAAKDSTADTLRYADRERGAIPGSLPGAVFRVRLDPTHPLAFGYGPETYALVTSSDVLTPFGRGNGWNVGTVRAGGRVSGFVGARVRTALDGSLLYGVEEMGQGHVVYLVNNPLFRGFWQGGHLLFDNALFRFVR